MVPGPARLLAIDDEVSLQPLLHTIAARYGFELAFRSDGRSALGELKTLRPAAVLLDLQMPDLNGLEVLRAIRGVTPEAQVILMTGHPTVDTAIEAVKLGAVDYISKPFDLERLGRLLTTIRRELERRQQLLTVESEIAREFEFYGMIGRSAAMQSVFHLIRRVAPHFRTALVTGETGTGKELVARALHLAGPRPQGPFVPLNCSAISGSLFESELFGDTRVAVDLTDGRAGVIEHADGGTLFLDEIGALPLPLQAKLLRVVEFNEVQPVGGNAPRPIDLRIIAATNCSLAEEVRHGRFREDLYYRLNVVEIGLPPLRDRREDLPYLTATFVGEFAARFAKPIAGLSAAAEGLLQRAPWTGNVRELRNVLERACMVTDDTLLHEADLQAGLGRSLVVPHPSVSNHADVTTERVTLDAAEVDAALRAHQGNKAAAARTLGISRRALYRFLDRA